MDLQPTTLEMNDQIDQIDSSDHVQQISNKYIKQM
jgi:hypothetical protein